MNKLLLLNNNKGQQKLASSYNVLKGFYKNQYLVIKKSFSQSRIQCGMWFVVCSIID